MHPGTKKTCKRWLSLLILPLLAALITSCVTASTLLDPGQVYAPERPAKGLKVHFLDVGQGDAIFIELPTGETMLIDAANAKDGPGIVRYIREAGYSRLDHVVATHPHADHIGGMAEVVRSLDIGRFHMPKKAHTTRTFEDMLLAVKEKGLGIHTARAGVVLLEEDSLRITMVAPVKEGYPELNDYSAVIRLDYGSTAFLFMGDAETRSEEEITADIDIDVLKVGHHGSNSSTSEAFLRRTTPDHAVISSGEGNTYGHPTPSTLAALQAHGIRIHRTDLSGTIVFISDGSTLTTDMKASGQASPKDPVSGALPNPAPAPAPSKVPVGSQAALFRSKTGDKYHVEGCRYLDASRMAITLEAAGESGLTPCGVCKPPQ